MDKIIQQKPITELRQKWGYAAGDIMGGGAFALIGMFFLGFLVNVQKIEPGYAAIILLIGRLCDGIVDPIIGMLSDRTKSKWGRRRPWFLLCVAPIFVCFSLMWNNLGIASQLGRSIYFTIMYVLTNVSCSLAMVPYSGLLPTLTSDYHKRTSYMAIRNVVSVASVAVSSLAPMLIWGMPNQQSQAAGYAVMGLIFGAVYALPWLLVAFNTRERAVEAPSARLSIKEIALQYRSTFRNKSFRQYLMIFLLGQGATDIVSGCLTFFVTWLVCINGAEGLRGAPGALGTILLAIVMVGEFVALPINVKVSKLKGKNVVGLINLPIRMIALFATFFVGNTTAIVALFVLVFLMGFGQSASSFVPWNILPDVTDVDEVITGQRREGVYAACATFFRQTSSGLALFLLGIFLQIFGYDNGAEFASGAMQSQSAMLGIRITFVVLPILFSMVVWLLCNKYKVSPAVHKRMREMVELKKIDKSATFSDEDKLMIQIVSGCKWEQTWLGQ